MELSADIRPPTAIAYRHAGGEMLTADSLDTARGVCPVLGSMSLEEAGLLYELQTMGQDSAKPELEIKATDNLPAKPVSEPKMAAPETNTTQNPVAFVENTPAVRHISQPVRYIVAAETTESRQTVFITSGLEPEPNPTFEPSQDTTAPHYKLQLPVNRQEAIPSETSRLPKDFSIVDKPLVTAEPIRSVAAHEDYAIRKITGRVVVSRSTKQVPFIDSVEEYLTLPKAAVAPVQVEVAVTPVSLPQPILRPIKTEYSHVTKQAAEPAALDYIEMFSEPPIAVDEDGRFDELPLESESTIPTIISNMVELKSDTELLVDPDGYEAQWQDPELDIVPDGLVAVQQTTEEIMSEHSLSVEVPSYGVLTTDEELNEEPMSNRGIPVRSAMVAVPIDRLIDIEPLAIDLALEYTEVPSEFVTERLPQNNIAELSAVIKIIEMSLIRMDHTVEPDQALQAVTVNRVIKDIIEQPEKRAELFVELLDELDLEYTFEHIESLLAVTRTGVFELPPTDVEIIDESRIAVEPVEIGTREFLQKLYHGLSAAAQSLSRLLMIGQSALKIYFSDRTFASR